MIYVLLLSKRLYLKSKKSMHFNQLITAFNTGVNWNAYLYTIYKITTTLTTLLLFRSLDTATFSAWANLNSITFLALLWTDFGFRKSLPRYWPEFAVNREALKWFIRRIILFQLSVLIITTPFLIFFIYYFGSTLNITHRNLIYAIPIIFIIEGIVSLMRLIFHAHFAQKQFNLLASWLLLGEAALGVVCVYWLHNEQLIYALIVNKAVCSSVVIVGASRMLPLLHRERRHGEDKSIDTNLIMRNFIKHSGVMWFNTSLRSLSERNFLVPLLTVTIGPELANWYKIANDGALLFQRMVLKTIGTADTSLLSYTKVMQNKKKLMEVAFKKLTTKIAALCLPLVGVIFLIMKEIQNYEYDSFVFQLFCIMAFSYLIELMLLPYERMLEVERRYSCLVGVYVFYAFALVFIIISNRFALIGFMSTIIGIGGVRLVSMGIMAWYARHVFNISFPYREVFSIVVRMWVLGCVGWLVIRYVFIQIPGVHDMFLFLIRVVMGFK